MCEYRSHTLHKQELRVGKTSSCICYMNILSSKGPNGNSIATTFYLI